MTRKPYTAQQASDQMLDEVIQYLAGNYPAVAADVMGNLDDNQRQAISEARTRAHIRAESDQRRGITRVWMDDFFGDEVDWDPDLDARIDAAFEIKAT